jgi:hypothetical protein
MANQKPVELITPPNSLRAKIGGPLPALDKSAIARAEAALDSLSDKFEGWIEEELTRLLEAWAAYEKEPGSPAALSELHRRSHDLKGLAPTYGYHLVGRICGSLSKLTGEEHAALKAPLPLLKAHVDATKAGVVGKIKGADHPVGLALARELEQRVVALVGADK